MQVLAESLLTSLKYRTINNQMKNDEINLKKLVDESVTKISPKAKSRNITISSENTSFKVVWRQAVAGEFAGYYSG